MDDFPERLEPQELIDLFQELGRRAGKLVAEDILANREFVNELTEEQKGRVVYDRGEQH